MRAPGLLLLSVSLLVSPLAAAVEKCVSPQGKVSYSEPPCPPGWKSSTVRGTESAPSRPAAAPAAPAGSAPSAGGARAGTTRTTAKPAGASSGQMAVSELGGKAEIRYYDVQGSDYGSLLAALNARGGSHGQAEWTVSYHYEPRRAGRNCNVGSLTTTVGLVMNLPRWSPPPGAPARLVAQWQRYVTALRAHEEGHFAIGREMAHELKRSLAVTKARCELLESTVKSQYGVLLERFRARDRAYDFETAHGKSQGAVFAMN
jgi:predicted secreted Zn-dependent protease